ncbi:hypothetical protein [Aquabacter cavernae]|uniref:hypothetical protein n=1 Tax=Aquabacter cavernae TaxID=2496029 RepID=UPI000F8E7B19|nr:hypothetical protein [Aquabacter cavernae]
MSEINFQRAGSVSNAHAGADFEGIAQSFFRSQGITLQRGFPAPLGVTTSKKLHKFDLGSDNPPILVECKSHKWTSGWNVPSAKLTVWNEAMLYFLCAPPQYRKLMFVLKHSRKDQSLASYYIRNYSHLIPEGVEFWEYCEIETVGTRIR